MFQKWKVIDYFACNAEKQQKYLERISQSDWDAGTLMTKMLKEGTFFDFTGEGSKFLLLIDTKKDLVASYCTYAHKDNIPNTELTPWMGFVYTYPEYRGKHLMWHLMDHVTKLCKKDKYSCFYISTGHEGLYEKYGAVFQEYLTELGGGQCRIYRKDVKTGYLVKANEWINSIFLFSGIGVLILSLSLFLGILLNRTNFTGVFFVMSVVGMLVIFTIPVWGLIFSVMGFLNVIFAGSREHRNILPTLLKLLVGLMVIVALFMGFLFIIDVATGI